MPALYAAGCRRFFVATRDEALELRPILDHCAGGQSGSDSFIHLLNGPFTEDDAALAAARISPIINSLAQLTRWKSVIAAHQDAPPCVLQFDTGMSRYGMSLAEAQRLAREFTWPPRTASIPGLASIHEGLTRRWNPDILY